MVENTGEGTKEGGGEVVPLINGRLATEKEDAELNEIADAWDPQLIDLTDDLARKEFLNSLKRKRH